MRMSYTATRHDDATALLSAAEPFLLQREALNSLMLGVARAQQHAARAQQHATAPRRRRPPLFLTVAGPTGPALVALSSAGRRLLLADNQAATGEALDTLVGALAATPRAVPVVFAHETLARRFAERWSAATGQATSLVERQRLLEATAVTLPPDVPAGRLRPATVRESDLLGAWLMAFQDSTAHHDAGDRHAAGILVDGLLARKDLFVWDVGDRRQPRPVAMAARSRPTARGIAISLVYTPPEERNRGYATACVAHLSQQLLDSDWQFCTLFADKANEAADALYSRIGYKPIADFVAYRFELPPSDSQPSHANLA
jgi:predicted GNAT family acetyltransferase